MEDYERQIRLTTKELESLLKAAKLVKKKETVRRIWIEPGELIIEVVR